MSSMMIKEYILCAKENHRMLHVCYLDIQKVFDRMWHNALFVKLYDMDIKLKLFGIIIDLHSNMKSCVYIKDTNLVILTFCRVPVRLECYLPS